MAAPRTIPPAGRFRHNPHARTARAGAVVLAVLLGGSALAADHPAKELIDRSALNLRISPEASLRDAETALRLLRQNPDPDLEVRARILLCEHQAERDREAAEAEIAAAKAILPNITRPGLRAGVLACEGETYETTGDNDNARKLYEEAVSVATAANDDEMLAGALFQRGYLLGLQGNYAAGLSDLRQSQALFEKVAMPHHALTALNGIAILYNRMGDFAQARDIYTRALKAQREAGLRREEAVTLHNLGRAHENLREWDSARQAFSSSLEISRSIGYPRGEAYALRGLAAAANAADDSLGALDLLDRADELQKQTPDARLRAQIQLTRGMALHRLNRLVQAVASLEDALAVFKGADARNELVATLSELAAVRAKLGDYRAAYELQSSAKATSEALLRNQLDQRFTTLKVEFDTAQKERENAQLISENQANALALAQAKRVRQLQGAVIVLTAMLAILLATLAIHQRRTSDRMRRLAMTDELTGVPNRRAILAQLEALLRNPDALPCAALIVDVDHFKSINDHHGHPAGDEVLRVIAQQMRTAVREPAFFGRLGGEEFLVVFPGTNVEDAVHAAERLREQVMQIDTVRWFADRRRITASIGLTVSIPGDTPSTLLQRADTALYTAKRTGRNRVQTELASESPTPEPPDLEPHQAPV
jgi:diguanylate cyclase (GGDEF)-like protein